MLNPHYITGFVDGEGCFCVSISQERSEVRLFFEIELREDDKPILEEIQKVLQCGSLHFFQKYPLQAKKKKQFDFFCKIAEMIEHNEHKTLEGIQRITDLREDFRKA